MKTHWIPLVSCGKSSENCKSSSGLCHPNHSKTVETAGSFSLKIPKFLWMKPTFLGSPSARHSSSLGSNAAGCDPGISGGAPLLALACLGISMGVSINRGTRNRWFTMENPSWMMNRGTPMTKRKPKWYGAPKMIKLNGYLQTEWIGCGLRIANHRNRSG